MSAEKQWPILLTAPSALPSASISALKSLGATSTVVVGSTKAVSATAASKLPALTRLSGSDRYTTSAAIADYADARGLGFGYVTLTSGRTFADAMAGGVLTAATHGTMLLTPPDRLAEAAGSRLAKNRAVTNHLSAFGSAKALDTEVVTQAQEALR
jgi:putative cell wall-binding protein